MSNLLRRAVTALGAAAALALVAGCGGGAGSSVTDVVPDVLAAQEGVSEMRHTVADLVVPGPGYTMSASAFGSPNRVGSLEVPVRTYTPQDPWATLVWAHGGSFVRGTLDWPESDWAAARFADSGVRVVAVDYVLASDEVKAPAPSNDVAAVARWARDTFQGPLIMGGASAGAHLAALATLTLAECEADALVQATETEHETAGSGPLPRQVSALALLYPTLHRVQTDDPAVSELTRGLPAQRQFGADRIAEMYRFYLGEQADSVEPREALQSSPCRDGYATQPLVMGELGSESLSRLPSTVIVNAEADDLRVSGEQFAAQLTEADVPVAVYTQPGTVHGYMNRPNESPRAEADARETIERFVVELRRNAES